jgi:dihydroorotate dehydrogenase electron transfer subunit
MPHWKEARVLHRIDLNPGYFLLDIEDPEMASEFLAGQFVMLHREEGDFPFLPRPFSACDLLYADGHEDPFGIRLLVQVMGTGTRSLSRMEAGARLAMWGPLGTHFRLEGEFGRAILVAGGIGVAPFPLLVRQLRERNPSLDRITLLYGARSARDLVLVDDLGASGAHVRLATDDGTRGFHGTVVDLLRDELESAGGETVQLYGCGPEPMLDALARFAVDRGLPCQLSLERMMGCGVGACLGCVVATKADWPDGYLYTKTCTEGPVLDADRLWLGAGKR